MAQAAEELCRRLRPGEQAHGETHKAPSSIVGPFKDAATEIDNRDTSGVSAPPTHLPARLQASGEGCGASRVRTRSDQVAEAELLREVKRAKQAITGSEHERLGFRSVTELPMVLIRSLLSCAARLPSSCSILANPLTRDTRSTCTGRFSDGAHGSMPWCGGLLALRSIATLFKLYQFMPAQYLRCLHQSIHSSHALAEETELCPPNMIIICCTNQGRCVPVRVRTLGECPDRALSKRRFHQRWHFSSS